MQKVMAAAAAIAIFFGMAQPSKSKDLLTLNRSEAPIPDTSSETAALHGRISTNTLDQIVSKGIQIGNMSLPLSAGKVVRLTMCQRVGYMQGFMSIFNCRLNGDTSSDFFAAFSQSGFSASARYSGYDYNYSINGKTDTGIDFKLQKTKSGESVVDEMDPDTVNDKEITNTNTTKQKLPVRMNIEIVFEGLMPLTPNK